MPQKTQTAYPELADCDSFVTHSRHVSQQDVRDQSTGRTIQESDQHSEGAKSGSRDQMTYTDLSKEKIAFGTAKLGQAFTEVIEDRRYVSWFVSNYQTSQKPSHVKFIRFVQLYVEREEMKPKAKAKSTPQPKGAARPYLDGLTAEETPIAHHSESESESQDDTMWEQISQPPRRAHSNAEMNDMQSRILQIEDMMQQVLQHLSQRPNA